MDLTLLAAFIFLSIGIIVVPGPNVLVIVSTSITHGKLRGVQTVVGTTSAMAIQLVIAAFGTAWLIEAVTDGFYILKWLGVCYLFYLGVKHFKQILFDKEPEIIQSASGSFAKGFVVSLTNPKTILFFSAFLPQFVSPTGNYAGQIAILSLLFLLFAAVLDSCYALLSARLEPVLNKYNLTRVQHGASGLLFLGASAWLASIRRV